MGTYYGPEWLRPFAMATWYPSDWFSRLDSGDWSKADQDAFDFLYQFDFYHGSFDKELNSRSRSKYFDRFDLDYSDIKDPRNAVGSVTTSSRSILRVSDNIKRLYRR